MTFNKKHKFSRDNRDYFPEGTRFWEDKLSKRHAKILEELEELEKDNKNSIDLKEISFPFKVNPN